VVIEICIKYPGDRTRIRGADINTIVYDRYITLGRPVACSITHCTVRSSSTSRKNGLDPRPLVVNFVNFTVQCATV
jgi:hypothetical protein